MTVKAAFRFGVDFVTFHHPRFWGVSTPADIKAHAKKEPVAFWTKLLDTAAAAGVTGVELTFSPFHWEDAVDAFGSVERFSDELTARGLSVASGFFADFSGVRDFSDPAVADNLIERALQYADFLKACGAEVMATGLPMRQTVGEQPVRIYDLSAATAIATLVNRVAVAVAARGIKLALHTEGHSVFSMTRDIDLMMMLTDPAYVHFCPDSAHIILMGGDPLKVVSRYSERIALAHWKDVKGPMPLDTPIDDRIFARHHPYFAPFGQGRVDWGGWISHMRHKTDTWHILELDAAPDPVADIRNGLRFINEMLASSRD
jgi:sugar phosphate isomerase/epimerase